MSAVRWESFEAARPDLEAVAREMLYHYGPGMGFLATVRRDGGPRVFPINPVLANGGLYGFIVPGPKLEDLRRDGRFALHSGTFAPPRHDDGLYVAGNAVEIEDVALRNLIAERFLADLGRSEPWEGFDDQAFIEFFPERCLITLTTDRAGLPAGHTLWRAAGG